MRVSRARQGVTRSLAATLRRRTARTPSERICGRNFPTFQSLKESSSKGRYIHHMSEIYGTYADVLKEFCKFIPGLEFDPIEE